MQNCRTAWASEYFFCHGSVVGLQNKIKSVKKYNIVIKLLQLLFTAGPFLLKYSSRETLSRHYLTILIIEIYAAAIAVNNILIFHFVLVRFILISLYI